MSVAARSVAPVSVGTGTSVLRHSAAWRDVHEAIGAGVPAPVTARALCRALMARGTPHPLRTVYRVLEKAERLGTLRRLRTEKHSVRDCDEWEGADIAAAVHLS